VENLLTKIDKVRLRTSILELSSVHEKRCDSIYPGEGICPRRGPLLLLGNCPLDMYVKRRHSGDTAGRPLNPLNSM